VGEDVEVAVEDERTAYQGCEDFLVVGRAEGEVGAGELGELVGDGVGEQGPAVGVVVGDVEDGEVVVVEGADAEGEVVVVGFDFDDGAFVGWVADGFRVFADAVGRQGLVSPVFVFGGGAVVVDDAVAGVVVVVADFNINELRDTLGEVLEEGADLVGFQGVDFRLTFVWNGDAVGRALNVQSPGLVWRLIQGRGAGPEVVFQSATY
jgi:hypothetical protein